VNTAAAEEENAGDAAAPQTAERPRPRIDAADGFALAGRLGTSLVLSTLSGLLIILGGDAQTRFAGGFTLTVAVLVFLAGIKLIFKMRAENPEYIAWRAAEEEARRAARLGGGKTEQGSAAP
jgi:hypothetical protein